MTRLAMRPQRLYGAVEFLKFIEVGGERVPSWEKWPIEFFLLFSTRPLPTVWFMRNHNFFGLLFQPFWLWILCSKSRPPCVFFFLTWFVHRLQSIHELTAGSSTFLISSPQNGGGSFAQIWYFSVNRSASESIFFILSCLQRKNCIKIKLFLH